METLHALDAQTNQAFLERIHPYNANELPDFETSELVSALDATARRTVGRVALTPEIPVFSQGKIPSSESISEETQEMQIPLLPETTAVEVKTVRLNADPRLVPFGENPRNYPTGNRQRFFLAKVLD